MNSEELEQSLRTEFENYLKNTIAEMKQEVSDFEGKIQSKFEEHKSSIDGAFQEFSAKFEDGKEVEESFRQSVAEHLKLAREDGSRITAEAFAEAEKFAEEEESQNNSASAAIQFTDIRDAINDISTKDSQSEILKSLVNHAAQWTPRGAFFIVKNEHLVGWRMFGTEEHSNPQVVREVFFPLTAKTYLSEAVGALTTVRGSGENDEDISLYLDKLGFAEPRNMYAIPLVARGRGVAVLYADNGTAEETVNVEMLETLMRVAGLTVEVLASTQIAKSQSSEEQPAQTATRESEKEQTQVAQENYSEDNSPTAFEEHQPYSNDFSSPAPAESGEYSDSNDYQPIGETAAYADSNDYQPTDSSSVENTLNQYQAEEDSNAYDFQEDSNAYDFQSGEESSESFQSEQENSQNFSFETVEDQQSEDFSFQATDEQQQSSGFDFNSAENSVESSADETAYDNPWQQPVQEAANQFSIETADDDDDYSVSFDTFGADDEEDEEPNEIDYSTSFESTQEDSSPAADGYNSGIRQGYDQNPDFETEQFDNFQNTDPVSETTEQFSEPSYEFKNSNENNFDTISIEPTSDTEFEQIDMTEPEVAVKQEVAPTPPVRPRFGDRNVDLPIEVAEDERRLHNDARRFARLLVSEIKLYNEQKVKEGRESSDLYERLREAIDRSREMYDKRVQPPVAAKFDYFNYELINTLAEGEEVKLGTSYPGATV